ncbi:MAG: hypothetical protein ACR2RL_01270 [Gammaproteobacteria bacterium]
MTRQEFVRQLEAEGYGNIRELVCEPDMSREMHTHDFAASVMVLSGDWSLVTEAGSTTVAPGETCKLAAGVSHTERIGPAGATILIGQK